MKQIRPVPNPTSTNQQRLELELLEQVKVLTPAELMHGHELIQQGAALDTETWRKLEAIPWRSEGKHLDIAIPQHWDQQSKDQLLRQLDLQGFSADLQLALDSDLESFRNTTWPIEKQLANNKQQDNDKKPSNIGEIIEDNLSVEETAASFLQDFNPEGVLEDDPDEAARLAKATLDLESSLEDTNLSPVVSLVDRILVQALQVGASDIHVEPQNAGLQVRFRQDGVLQKYTEPLPSRLVPAVTSRFKIMADLDISERRVAQDGRIRRKYKNHTIDFRVSTLPSRFGEKICLRLLDSSATQLSLDKLISNEDALNLVRELGSKPFGMILVTGPTGSGKSTTLYSLLAERNDPGINISTVEDPIEYTLPGITQCQVNREKGFDFSSALRAFMRQDPDVLLVGETRDLETAKTAIEAALTGHLVLTTLHCNDAPSAIARLSEMGVEPFMVGASLIGIISQRLLRRVCTKCRESYHPQEKELGLFGLMAHTESDVTFFKAHHHKENEPVCNFCQGSGYRGRIGVYEILRMNEELATAVSAGETTEALRRLALESGMKTLLGYSLELVRQGHTTLEEVGRMILTDTGLESERRARALTTLSCRGCGAGLQEGWLECPYCLTIRQ